MKLRYTLWEIVSGHPIYKVEGHPNGVLWTTGVMAVTSFTLERAVRKAQENPARHLMLGVLVV